MAVVAVVGVCVVGVVAVVVAEGVVDAGRFIANHANVPTTKSTPKKASNPMSGASDFGATA